MLNSNKPIKVAHLQNLENQLILNSALVIETINTYFIVCLVKQERSQQLLVQS